MTGGDTIMAVASGAGPSGRALVRVSGPGVGHICASMLAGASARRWAGSARLRLGAVSLPVLAMRCVAPASYTGEDTLELVLPGNDTLVARVLGALRTVAGVRDAEPGEFSARAYLHGRLTLAQAEGVSALIAASSSQQAESARRVLRGDAATLYAAWAEELATLLALVEAGIDFADQEDVTAIEAGTLARRVGALLEQMDRHAGARAGREAASARVRVALVGAPNAGKSTLFNALLGRGRAVVSAVAGTTRDALVEPMTLSGDLRGPVAVDLIDLAGLDDGLAAGGSIDAAAQQRAREEIARADVLVQCTPAHHDRPAPRPLDHARVLHVRTKADSYTACTGSGHTDGIAVCALDGRGMDALRRALYEAAWSAGAGMGGAVPACVARHAAAIAECAGVLRLLAADLARDTALESRATRRAPASPEIVADQLRTALDALSAITGRVERDEVIGRIFATFCIGK